MLVTFLLLSGIARTQPSYSDRDDSDFKAKTAPSKASSLTFKVKDLVKFPHGNVLYSNLKDLKYYEGPTTTSDERTRFEGTFLVGDGGTGSVQMVTTYVNAYGKIEKAYRVYIFEPGSVNGRKLKYNHTEGWVPGNYGMEKR